MLIEINEFKGIMPKVSNDKLPPNMAQLAQDVRTSSGMLYPIKRSTADVLLPGSSYKTFFEYIENGNNHWVYYDNIVHWSRAPVDDDIFERMYFTGISGEYRAFANDINSAPWDFTVDYYTPGAPVGQAPTMGGYTGGGAGYYSYFYSFQSRYGEEGPGSALAEITDWTSGRRYVDDITRPAVADDHLLTAVGSNYPRINVYRTETTGAGSSVFLRVCSAYWFDVAQTYTAGDYVFYDDGGGWDLYECTVGGVGTWAGGTHTFVHGELNTAPSGTTTGYLWNRCPDDLTNLRSHPNGFFVASKGKMLHFSEPYAPWAWPEDYQIPIDSEIIGLGIFGSTIVVVTDGYLYTFSGPHPDSLYKTRLSFQPGLSQRGVVETDDGVMFPSKEGFILINHNGAVNVTSELFSPDDWEDYELETCHGSWYNKAYYGWYKSADFEGGFVIDFLNGSITTGLDYHWASHVALIDGKFRTIVASSIADSSLYISQWGNDSTRYRNYQYKSPRYILAKPSNFKVAQVILDTDFYNTVIDLIEDESTLTGLNAAQWALGVPEASLNDFIINSQDVNGDNLYTLGSLGVQEYVEFKIYVDSVLKFTKHVMYSTMFKLPRGFRNKKWEIEITGMIPVKRVLMATSTEEIV